MAGNEVAQLILTLLEIVAATTAATVPGTMPGVIAMDADLLLKIAQASVSAYQAQTGQPLDLNLLADIT